MKVATIGWLICKLTKHRRGKLVVSDKANGTNLYRCPRCGAEWLRKVKPKVAA